MLFIPLLDRGMTYWQLPLKHSAIVKDTSKLGYTYPEFNGIDAGNTDAVTIATGNIVNQLYGSGFFAAVLPSIPALNCRPSTSAIKVSSVVRAWLDLEAKGFGLKILKTRPR